MLDLYYNEVFIEVSILRNGMKEVGGYLGVVCLCIAYSLITWKVFF